MTRYELLDRIGVGGMAEIFRGKAVAAGGFEKPVAIKRILPHLSQDTRFVELLIAEAKVLSLLKHRNIVQIFDVGLGDDQQYFLVMEYVDGKDLGAIQRGLETRRKRMPFDLALHVGAEICEALEHAHSARAPDGKAMSLVHRDVSPSNVLLSRAGEIKLTDFGIAKRAEQEQTSGGSVKGKFAYISPEQARNEPVDPRSDVFSVGILLWELICNRRLFSGMSDMEALRAVRDPTKIQRPSEIDPRLTPELDALVMSALDPERARRPTAGMLGAKIRAMRYSLEVTVGDPATELAKIIDAAEQVERQSVLMPVVAEPSGPRMTFDPDAGEATVIRIRTADAFSMRDRDGTGMAAARQVIDRFEEEETRLAQLTSEQLQALRSGARDSSEVQPLPRPPEDRRPRRPTDEPTVARAPLTRDELDGEIATFAAGPQGMRDQPPNRSVDSDEHTRLVAPRDRRTPVPERVPRAATVPPPVPRARALTPVPSDMRASQPNLQLAPTPHPLPDAGAWNTQQPSYHQAPPQPAMHPGMMPQPPMQPHYPSQPQPYPQPYPTPVPQHNPYQTPLPQHNPYPMWNPGAPNIASNLPQRAASPTTQDSFDRPMQPYPGSAPARPSMPQVAGFGKPKKTGLKPWMLVVGALIVAGLAFAITRAFIAPPTMAKPGVTDK